MTCLKNVCPENDNIHHEFEDLYEGVGIMICMKDVCPENGKIHCRDMPKTYVDNNVQGNLCLKSCLKEFRSQPVSKFN